MPKGGIDTIDKARQTIAEGIWLAGLGLVSILGIEGVNAKGIGYGAVKIEHILISASYAIVIFGLWKRWKPLAALGIILPLVHVGMNLTIIMIVLNGAILYFQVNAMRALFALDQ
ncbi:MAG: hypothetical protein OQK23_06715, partial [Rhodospirillales bacterium]|nr:hypothetical protein [Rhodospirillales bacterium]